MIVAGQVTREGTYVALTRAREQTHIYNADSEGAPPGTDWRERLAERVSRTEPEVPSISTPLAHEAAVAARAELEEGVRQITPNEREITQEPGSDRSKQSERDIERFAGGDCMADPPKSADEDLQELGDEQSDLTVELSDERHPLTRARTEQEVETKPERMWPGHDPRGPERDEGLTREESYGWEP